MRSNTIPAPQNSDVHALQRPVSPRIDVVVCCHNDAALLPRLFEALATQTVPAETFRVIVVDNASEDAPEQVTERYRDRLEILFIKEPVLGLNRARNAAIRHATTKYVAHVDADTIPDRGWLGAILDVTETVDCDVFGGPYRPFYVTPKPAWFQDRFLTQSFGDRPRYLDGRDHPHGMNMVWKRETVNRLGGFSTDVGLHGRGLARGDETELFSRGRRSIPGFRAYYHPAVSVRTAARPEVLHLRYWIRRWFQHGRACRAMWSGEGPGTRWPWPLRAAFAAAAATKLLSCLAWRDRQRHPHFKTCAFDALLSPLFHIGSAYQDFLDSLRWRQPSNDVSRRSR